VSNEIARSGEIDENDEDPPSTQPMIEEDAPQYRNTGHSAGSFDYIMLWM
jgi:hypothetical protein